jgi:imidazolonepropionase-like amidohydrolase
MFAEAMGLGNQLGSIAAGRLADLVVVEGNPLERIADARRVRVVVKAGEVFTAEELMAGAIRRRPQRR